MPWDQISIEFMRPAVLLLAPVLVGWLIVCWARSLVDLPAMQMVFSLVVRSLVVLCLLLALAGLSWMRPTQQKFIVVLVDQSLSMGAEARQFVSRWLAEFSSKASQHDVVYLPFARTAGRITERFEDLPEESDDAAMSPEQLATDFERAVAAGTAAIPPFYVPQLVLISDGNPTHGDAMQAASTAQVPIFTIPVPNRTEDEVQVAELVAPANVREGEPFYLEIVVDSTRPQSAHIDIYRDDIRVDLGSSAQVELSRGENRFRFPQTAGDRRNLVYTASVQAEHDTLLDNNQASSIVTSVGKPHVLLVDSDLQTSDTLRWALEEQGIRVDLRPMTGMPDKLAEIQEFDAVMLSNVPATELTLTQLQTVRTYVRDLGGGLIVLGGDQSFGLGGYYKSTLDEILPVRSDFEKEKEKPSLAMVLIIDRSGSMGGIKLELAKDAARGAAELLGPRDQIGVIAFDIETYWVSELHSAADKEFVINRIRTLAPGGGTNMYPALVEAHRALQSAVAKLKHVIILTDGISAPGDFAGVTADMAGQRITVSTVAVGNGADQKLLEQIAELGQGRFYLCEDPQSVPQIFAKETMTASRSAINELPFLPQLVRATAVLDGVDVAQAPPLLGFVATRSKPTSEVILSTENGEPLLAWWRYGLGKTVAFTSDAKARWSSEWISWPDFPTFWAQIVRSAMRNRNAAGGQLMIDRHNDQVTVTLDAADATGRFRNQAPTQLSVVSPDSGDRQEIEMIQTAPGRYAASFQAATEGAYLIDVRQSDSQQLNFQKSQGVFVGYPSELRLRSTNVKHLRQIAEASGGMFDPSPEELLADNDLSVRRAEVLWPYLLGLALLLFVIDVALRRISLDGLRRESS